MDVTVVDLGPVDWGRIWGARDGLVDARHLAELNAISPATHLSAPGYWRNLFASYPEVIANAGLIARQFSLPGREPKTFSTNQRAQIPNPTSANKFVQDKRNETLQQIAESQRESAELEKNPFKKAAIMAKRDAEEIPVVQSAEKAVQIVGETAENALLVAKNITSYAREATEKSNLNASWLPILLVGGALTGVIAVTNFINKS